jgi:hypothetical protein
MLRQTPVIRVSALEYVETMNADSPYDKLTARQAPPVTPRSGAFPEAVIRQSISYHHGKQMV